MCKQSIPGRLSPPTQPGYGASNSHTDSTPAIWTRTISSEYAYQVLKHEAILGASVLSYVKAHLFGAVHVHIH